MLDIRFIREHPDLVQAGARKKRIDIDIRHLLALDEQRRSLISQVESLKARRNAMSNQPVGRCPRDAVRIAQARKEASRRIAGRICGSDDPGPCSRWLTLATGVSFNTWSPYRWKRLREICRVMTMGVTPVHYRHDHTLP